MVWLRHWQLRDKFPSGKAAFRAMGKSITRVLRGYLDSRQMIQHTPTHSKTYSNVLSTDSFAHTVLQQLAYLCCLSCFPCPLMGHDTR